MSYDIDLDKVVALLRQDGVDAYVEMTGGGIATIFAGPTRPMPEDPEFREYAACAGPGSYSDHSASLYDFVVGVENGEGEGEYVEPLTLGVVDEEGVARLIAAQARNNFQPLSADQVEELGYDGTARSTPDYAAWVIRRQEVGIAAYNQVVRSQAATGTPSARPWDNPEAEAARIRAEEEWEAANPQPREEEQK
jgi:hypothetical protein